jgi:hypothetical protein
MAETEIQIHEATVEDAAAIARLLHDFNLEFDDRTPGVETIAVTLRRLLARSTRAWDSATAKAAPTAPRCSSMRGMSRLASDKPVE